MKVGGIYYIPEINILGENKMRLLKTVLLCTTLLMSAPFGAEHVPGETSNVNKAEAEVFTNGLRAIRNEQAAQLTFTVEMLKDLPVSEAEKKPDNVTNALLTISECIDALIRNQTTLETDLATAKGGLERKATELDDVGGELQAARDGLATQETELNRLGAELQAARDSFATQETELNRLGAELRAARALNLAEANKISNEAEAGTRAIQQRIAARAAARQAAAASTK
jgi:chromosome segregation ATPase